MNLFQRLLVGVFLMFGMATFSVSQDRGFGLGIVIGEPTGISFKNWLNSRNAVDGGVAWSFTKEASFDIHVDYLWHSFDAIQSKEPFHLYYGVGGRIKATGRARLGVRGVIGIGYIVRNAPVDCFLEAVPIFEMTPETGLGLNAGLGARYFFE